MWLVHIEESKYLNYQSNRQTGLPANYILICLLLQREMAISLSAFFDCVHFTCLFWLNTTFVHLSNASRLRKMPYSNEIMNLHLLLINPIKTRILK